MDCFRISSLRVYVGGQLTCPYKLAYMYDTSATIDKVQSLASSGVGGRYAVATNPSTSVPTKSSALPTKTFRGRDKNTRL